TRHNRTHICSHTSTSFPEPAASNSPPPPWGGRTSHHVKSTAMHNNSSNFDSDTTSTPMPPTPTGDTTATQSMCSPCRPLARGTAQWVSVSPEATIEICSQYVLEHWTKSVPASPFWKTFL